eukprot:6205491-Pleurochrysis_carterae.AAC.1
MLARSWTWYEGRAQVSKNALERGDTEDTKEKTEDARRTEKAVRGERARERWPGTHEQSQRTHAHLCMSTLERAASKELPGLSLWLRTLWQRLERSGSEAQKQLHHACTSHDARAGDEIGVQSERESDGIGLTSTNSGAASPKSHSASASTSSTCDA